VGVEEGPTKCWPKKKPKTVSGKSGVFERRSATFS